MSCRTGCSRKISLPVLLLAVAILAMPAFAQTCLLDEYNKVQKQKLNCTANDVSIAGIKNIRDPQTGNPITTCFQGGTFNFIADFEIKTTSSQARENIGLYIATNSTTQALTGTCVDSIISPINSAQYHETDPAPDNCGDTQSSDSSPLFGAGTEDVTLEIDNFSCTAPAGSSTLVLPNCTSWQIPGGTIQCVSPAPGYPYPFNGPNGTPTAIPGSPSKCNCDIISLPITPVTATADVQKACTTTSTPGPATFTQNPDTEAPTTCDAGQEGSTVTYTVSVTNTTTNGGIVVDQVCDSVYGTIYDDNLLNSSNTRVFPVCAVNKTPAGCTPVGGVTPTSCPLAGAANVNCPPSASLLTAKGDSATCTFTAPVGENVSGLQDTVTASGHSTINTSSTFSQGSNPVTVNSTDAPSTATLTKSAVATEAACATVRYNVQVDNTSSFDETLTLSGLNDSVYGDLTKCTNTGCATSGSAGGSLPSPQILGTNCGVATALGTLLSNPGAGPGGAFSTIAPGKSYSCQFDAQFCSAINAGCISQKDKVTPSLAGDEGAGETVTETGNTLTVNECVALSTSTTTP